MVLMVDISLFKDVNISVAPRSFIEVSGSLDYLMSLLHKTSSSTAVVFKYNAS